MSAARRPDVWDALIALPLFAFGLLLTATVVLAIPGIPMVLIAIELLTPPDG